MSIPILDLGESRTGYDDDTFKHLLEWGSDNVNPLFVETIEASRIASNGDTDSGTTISDNGDFTYTYSGNFTVESFPNVTMEFRDFETESDTVTITGWPPTDERAKDMFNFSLDPRDARTLEIAIEWKISATLEVITPADPEDPESVPTSEIVDQTSSPYFYDADLDKYVRTETFTFRKDAVNRTGELFGVAVTEYTNSNFSYESTAIKKEVDSIKSAFPPSTVDGIYEGTETSISRSYSPSNSEWYVEYSEETVMDTLISSESSSDWQLRVGKGSQIYSLRTSALGELIPPQYRSYGGDGQWAPWVDEVWQTTATYDRSPVQKSCHSAGVYLDDPILTEPFPTPRLSTEIDNSDRSFYSMNWLQPSAKEFKDDNPSHAVNFAKYKDLGDGVIEMTCGLYNFNDTETYRNHGMPWGGVRASALYHNYVSNTDGTTYTKMVGKFSLEKVTAQEAYDNRVAFDSNETAGWIIYCEDDTGDFGKSMGIVFGTKPQLTNSFRENRIRQGYAELNPKEGDTNVTWRNTIIYNFNLRHNVNEGEGVWTRSYLVLGDSRDDVENKIKNRNLVDNTIFDDMNITPELSDTVGYKIINDSGNFVIERSSTPDFNLYTTPVSGTTAVFEIVKRDNSRFVSWNPYKAGTYKMYDGLIKHVNLLGFTPHTEVYDDSLDKIFEGPFEHSYKASGKLLSGVIS